MGEPGLKVGQLVAMLGALAALVAVAAGALDTVTAATRAPHTFRA